MNLVILHHHLNPGGVTRVVENHLRALAASGETPPERVLLLHGGRCQGWPQAELAAQLPYELQIAIVEGFDYDLTGAKASDKLGKRIRARLASESLVPEDTLLHWHNHSLGKNASTPLAVAELAQAGYQILLQVHDFAEDFRPGNYRYLTRKLADQRGALPELLYPQGAGIHYAVLNGRDRRVFQAAGVAAERLHFLPNPVSPPPIADDAQAARELLCEALDLDDATGRGDKPLVVYPVRGIRRKNLGELLLWSAVFAESSFVVTLAPKNPAERTSFDRWAALADELQLACRFGVPDQTPAGTPITFADSLAASDYLLTTSIAEGFGMAFLECWLADRMLLGRILPEITADFVEAGLDLSSLYETLEVPTDWLDAGEFMSQMTLLVAGVYEGFGVATTTPKELKAQLQALLEAPTIDFARLPSTLQASIIRRVQGDATSREQLLALNPQFTIPPQPDGERIDANAAATRATFSLPTLGKRLSEVYRQLASSPPTTEITPLAHPSEILDAFLSIDRLHALRVES